MRHTRSSRITLSAMINDSVMGADNVIIGRNQALVVLSAMTFIIPITSSAEFFAAVSR